MPSYSSALDKDKVSAHDDGLVNLCFGPVAPAGKWLQTVPGKGWLILIHSCSPIKDWYDRK